MKKFFGSIRFVLHTMSNESRLVLMLAFASIMVAFVITTIYQGNTFFASTPESKSKIVVILKSVDYKNLAFWESIKDGVEVASKDFGVDLTITGPQSETQIDEQIRIIQEAIRSKPDAIILAAADYTRLVPIAREIKENHIPLVLIDSFINGDDADSKIGTNNYEAGQKAGSALMNYIQPGGEVIIMSYVQGSSTAIDRESGVRNYLKGKCEISQTLYSSGESEIAYKQAKKLISENPQLKGIITLNDPTTIGAAQALDESGKKTDIVLIGFDKSVKVLGYVEAGVVRDTIVQKPFNMGYLGIKTALDLVQGKKVDKFIDTGSIVINRQNMLLPENQKLLFPINR